MVKKSWVTFVLATTLIGLTGCANNNNNAANDNAGNMGVNNVRNNTNNGVNVRNVSNQNLRVSNRAINNVESLKEVDDAHVIIRNNDAYVAVRLNNNIQDGTRANRGTTGTGPNMNATYGNGYNSGTTGTNGDPNMRATTGTRNNADITRTNDTRTNATIYRTNDLNARGASSKGNAGTTNTSALEQKIINQVRKADRSIDNVYISYDTDTFGQMTNYSNDLLNGNNRDGLWNDFTNSVNRMFR